MTKRELADALAADVGIRKDDAMQLTELYLKLIRTTLRRGEEVNLAGFGKFTVSYRPSRKGTDPRTGKPMMVPATKVVRFKPATKLKEQVRG